MTAAISAFFASIFGNNIVLATMLVSMLPLFELRGAIIFASSVELWGAVTLTPWLAYLFSFLGSSLVVPVIALLFTPIVNWLKRTKLFKKLGDAIYNMVSKKSQKIQNDANVINEDVSVSEIEKQKKLRIKKMLGIFCFVAIPLPLTGVWTGTAIAVVLGMKFGDILISVISGNAVAGLIITLLTLILGDKSIYGLYAFVALVVVFILVSVTIALVKRAKNKKLQESEVSENKEN